MKGMFSQFFNLGHSRTFHHCILILRVHVHVNSTQLYAQSQQDKDPNELTFLNYGIFNAFVNKSTVHSTTYDTGTC